jgi:hypothetical protein
MLSTRGRTSLACGLVINTRTAFYAVQSHGRESRQRQGNVGSDRGCWQWQLCIGSSRRKAALTWDAGIPRELPNVIRRCSASDPQPLALSPSQSFQNYHLARTMDMSAFFQPLQRPSGGHKVHLLCTLCHRHPSSIICSPGRSVGRIHVRQVAGGWPSFALCLFGFRGTNGPTTSAAKTKLSLAFNL